MSRRDGFDGVAGATATVQNVARRSWAPRLAEVADDESIIFFSELRVALVSEHAGDLRAARSAIEAANGHESVVIDAASPLVGYDAWAFAPGFFGVIAQDDGQLEESLRWFELGIERARARGATEVLSWNLSLSTEAWLALGDFARARSAARESMEISETIGDMTAHGMALCAPCRFEMHEGTPDDAIALAEQWIANCEKGVRMDLSWAVSTLAVLRNARGEHDEARRLAHEARQQGVSEERSCGLNSRSRASA